MAGLPGKKAPAKRTKIGNRPAQDINGIMAIVTRRDFRLSMERVAIIAGTLHPKPITMGMKLFP